MCKRSPGCEEVAPGLSRQEPFREHPGAPRDPENALSLLTLDGEPSIPQTGNGESMGAEQARTARQRGAGLLGWTMPLLTPAGSHALVR